MKYYIDTEFLEGPQEKRFFGFKTGKKTKNTIDLISIGIVAEDGREYYAISKDFNLKEAWNRYNVKEQTPYEKQHGSSGRKIYWIRENVLKPIYIDLFNIEHKGKGVKYQIEDYRFTYKEFKRLLNKYGKTNRQLAEEIKTFINKETIKIRKSFNMSMLTDESRDNILRGYVKPEFYAYYADYDWVAFCWLFGKMVDLPKGFPMYCIDLKQILDEEVISYFNREDATHYLNDTFEEKLRLVKNFKNYPKQTNEHNALADAKWNRDLHKFLNNL